MSEPVYKKIIDFLESHQVEFTLYEHEPVFTSQQAAAARNTKIEQGAKALVMIADKKAILVVISAARKVDFKRLKKTFGFKDLRLASPQEVKETTGLEIGAVPPWGNLLGLPTVVDQSLGKNQQIVFNAGLHTKSVKMDYDQYFALSQAKLARFSLEKNGEKE